MATHRRLRSALISAHIAFALVGVAACGGSRGSADEAGGTVRAAWGDTAVDAVSRPVIGSGVAAVTALRPEAVKAPALSVT